MSANLDTESVPFVPAAAAGLLAWVLGYVFTYLLVGSEVRESALNRFVEAFEGDPATYELVGWAFYNAHFVDVVYEGFTGRFLPANYVGGEDGLTPLLYVVPPLLLVAAGLAVARYQGATEPTDGAVAGVLVVPGYLVLAVAGAFLFEVAAAGTTGRPDLLPAIFIAGLVYPAVFGAVGGVLAAVTAEDARGSRNSGGSRGPGS